MKFIKNERALRRWLLEFANVAGVDRYNVNSQPKPKKYPCYAYAVLKSFCYEEEQPKYLYKDDIEKMAAALARKDGK